nr:MAG TPA: hypothetical protein [Caudoviricetes sp.]
MKEFEIKKLVLFSKIFLSTMDNNEYYKDVLKDDYNEEEYINSELEKIRDRLEPGYTLAQFINEMLYNIESGAFKGVYSTFGTTPSKKIGLHYHYSYKASNVVANWVRDNETGEVIFNVRYYNHPEGYQLQIDKDGKITYS